MPLFSLEELREAHKKVQRIVPPTRLSRGRCWPSVLVLRSSSNMKTTRLPGRSRHAVWFRTSMPYARPVCLKDW